MATSLIVLFVIKGFGIAMPYAIDAGAFALVLSLTVYIVISLMSPPPKLDPDVERVMDI